MARDPRRDEDDAPWLAEATPPQTRVSRRSLFWTLLVLLGLAAVIAVGLVLLLSKKDSGSTQGYMEAGQAPLITAEPGPYKVVPANPQGLAVEGQDQTIYAAGEGIDQGSIIDETAMPEAPLPRPGTAPPPGLPQDLVPSAPAADSAPVFAPPPPGAAAPTAPKPPATTAKPPQNPPKTTAVAPKATTPAVKTSSATPAAAPIAPVAPPKTAASTSVGTVQLGAFSTREKADAAWVSLVARHGLAGFTKKVSPIDSNGTVLWRLRGSGGDAAALCARLKAAGAPCSVVG